MIISASIFVKVGDFRPLAGRAVLTPAKPAVIVHGVLHRLSRGFARNSPDLRGLFPCPTTDGRANVVATGIIT